MSAYIFDIDGTIVNYHTHQWIDGAREMLHTLNRKGHDIIFITMRDSIRDVDKAWSVENTYKLMEDLDFEPKAIIFNVQSPRIIIDDNKIASVRRKQNKKWEYDELDNIEYKKSGE